MKRRTFISGVGLFATMPKQLIWQNSEKLLQRIVVASDSHYGQPNTAYHEMSIEIIKKINYFHSWYPCDVCILNGDIIHDDPTLLPKAAEVFKFIELPLYAVRGNHDRVSADSWENAWGHPLNYSFQIGKTAFVLADSSNEKGEYLSPDLNWLKSELQKYRKLSTLFLFVHIPQKKWTPNAIENPDFFKVLEEFNNIRAVFHGHEHLEDGIKELDGLACLFDSHIGGSWGTEYNGFRVIEVYKGGKIISYMMNPDLPLAKFEISSK